MAQDNEIVDTPEPELTLDQEIAQMQGSSDSATQTALDSWAADSDRIAQESTPELQPGAELSPGPDLETPQAPITAPDPLATSQQETATANAEIQRLTAAAETSRNEAELAQQETAVNAEVIRYTQQLVQSGQYTEEAARAISEAQGQAYIANQRLDAERSRNIGIQLSQVAQNLAREHGVPVEQLMVHSTVEGMTTAAQHLGPQAKRLTDLEELVRAEKKASIPAQNYNQPGRTTGASSENQLLDQYNNGVRTEQTEAAAARAMGQ